MQTLALTRSLKCSACVLLSRWSSACSITSHRHCAAIEILFKGCYRPGTSKNRPLSPGWEKAKVFLSLCASVCLFHSKLRTENLYQAFYSQTDSVANFGGLITTCGEALRYKLFPAPPVIVSPTFLTFFCINCLELLNWPVPFSCEQTAESRTNVTSELLVIGLSLALCEAALQEDVVTCSLLDSGGLQLLLTVQRKIPRRSTRSCGFDIERHMAMHVQKGALVYVYAPVLFKWWLNYQLQKEKGGNSIREVFFYQGAVREWRQGRGTITEPCKRRCECLIRYNCSRVSQLLNEGQWVFRSFPFSLVEEKPFQAFCVKTLKSSRSVHCVIVSVWVSVCAFPLCGSCLKGSACLWQRSQGSPSWMEQGCGKSSYECGVPE